jgi:hypothetical protein
MYSNYQIGGGKCGICQSPGTVRTTCPDNPKATNINYEKHPLAKNRPGNAKVATKPKPRPKAAAMSNPKPKPRAAAKPRPRAAAKPKAPRICNNESTLMGDEINDIPENKLFISKQGNCFDIEDDLFQWLLDGKTTDPYTQQPLWDNIAERDRLLNHQGLPKSKRALLKQKLAGSHASLTLLNIIRKYPALYHQLGTTALICYADYHTDFTPSTEALGALRAAMDSVEPMDRAQIAELKTTNGALSLIDIMSHTDGCVHGVGKSLLRIYLSIWYSIEQVDTRPALVDGCSMGVTDNVTICTVYSISNASFYVLIYIHDPDSLGFNSYMTDVNTVDYVSDDGGYSIVTDELTVTGRPNDREINITNAVRSVIEEDVNDGDRYVPWVTFDMPASKKAMGLLIAGKGATKRQNIHYIAMSG